MTPFPPNKNAKELGIDTSREFVVLKNSDTYFLKGTILTLVKDDNSDIPYFTDGNSNHHLFWDELAYATDSIELTVDILMKWLDKGGTYDKRSVKALAKKINKI